MSQSILRSTLLSTLILVVPGLQHDHLELKGEKLKVFPFSENYAALQDVPIASVCTV
jgi:hypothetical protein